MKEFLEFFQADGDLILLAVDTVSDGTGFGFVITQNNGVGDLFHLGRAETIAKLFRGFIDFNAESLVAEIFINFFRVFAVGGIVNRQ